MKNEQIIVSNLEAEELKLRIARGPYELGQSALKDTQEFKCRHHAIAALKMMAKHQNFSTKPSDDQAAIACSMIDRTASSVRRIQVDCLSQFTSKSKVHVAQADMVPDLIEQHSFEACRQQGSRPVQPTASRCTPPLTDRAPSTKVHEVVV